MTDQAIAFGSGNLSEATVRQMLGSVDRSYVFKLVEALAQNDGKTVVEISESLRMNGLSAASTLEEMSHVLQRMAVIQATGQSGSEDDSDPEAGETARLAALLPADETQLLYSICLHGRSDLGLAPDEYAALTMVLLRLLAFKPQGATTVRPAAAISPPAEKKTLAKAEPAAATPIAAPAAAPVAVPKPWEDAVPPGQVLPVRDAAPHEPDPEPTPKLPLPPAVTKVVAVPVRQQIESHADMPAQPVTPVLVPTEEGDFWHALVQQLIAEEAIAALVRELALQSQLVARDTDQWLLRVERESLNQAGTRDRLTAALHAAGHGVKLVVEVGRVSDCPARRNAAASAERQLAAEKIIFEAPLVQAMMRDFGAKIVPGTIKPF